VPHIVELRPSLRRNQSFCGRAAIAPPPLLAGDCRMDLPGPTTSVGTRTDYSVGPWDYPTCAARYLLA
jgi:hypothetical protein